MSSDSPVIRLDEIEETPLRDAVLEESNWRADLNYCMSCAKCLSVCPLHGYSEWDPRRVVRMVLLGLEQQVIDSEFIFQCTGCDRCHAHGADQADTPGAVGRIDDDRQMAQFFYGRYGTQIQRVAGVSFKGANTALA